MTDVWHCPQCGSELDQLTEHARGLYCWDCEDYWTWATLARIEAEASDGA